jgi:hypothetical protein
MCGKALNFFSSAENYFASFKILAGMCGVRVCGASAPTMSPKVSSACCYAKEGRVTFQTLTTQILFISEYLLTELFLLKHGDSGPSKVMSVPSAGCGRVRRKGALLMKHATAVCCLPSNM